MASFPTSIVSITNPEGTSLLTNPDHAGEHTTINDEVIAIETKLGLGAGTPKADYALIGTGNGTAVWGSVWNNATFGTPTITGGTINGAILTNITGLTKPFITVGTANADYITNGTNDTTQLQAAIDAVNSIGGGMVFVKAGTYNIGTNDAASMISNTFGYARFGLELKSGVEISGEGIGKTVFTTGTIPGTTVGGYFCMFTSNASTAATNIGLANLSINLPSLLAGASGYFDNAFFFAGCTNAVFENIRTTNGGWGIAGVTYSYNGTTKELTSDASNILFDNVTVDTHVGSNTFYIVTDTTLRNSKIYNSHDDGLIVISAAQRLTIENNVLDGQNNAVIGGGSTGMLYLDNDTGVSTDFDAISDIKILNNTIRRFNLVGYDCSAIALAKVKNILIRGNTMEQCGYGITSAGGNGLQNIQVYENVIKNNRSYGIYFPDAAPFQVKNVNISFNQIYNNVNDSVFIQTARSGTLLQNLTIVGNTCYDNQGTITQTGGFNISAVNSGVVGDQILFVGNHTWSGTATDRFTGSSSGTLTNLKIKSNTGIADN